MAKDLERREFIIDLEDENSCVYNISLVEYPAIEKDFEYFDKIKNNYVFNEELFEIEGCIMIPDMDILRYDYLKKEYYNCWFSQETVKEFAYRFLKQKNTDAFTLHHKYSVQDLYLVESWIVVDEDEAKKCGVNLGTWMGRIKCENMEIWEDVKKEVVKGFSVEVKNILVEDDEYNRIINVMNKYIDIIDVKTL
jgi:hypothetical protein